MTLIRTLNRRRRRLARRGGEAAHRASFAKARLYEALRMGTPLEPDDPELAKWPPDCMGRAAHRIHWIIDADGLAKPLRTEGAGGRYRGTFMLELVAGIERSIQGVAVIGHDRVPLALRAAGDRDWPFVSTVFLGAETTLGRGNAPLLYETMIFHHKYLDMAQYRYTTRRQAEAGHRVALRFARHAHPWRLRV